MFNHALDDGHLMVNPTVRVLRRTRVEDGEQKPKTTFLTHEEVALLLQTCREHFSDQYPLILLLTRTGLSEDWGGLCTPIGRHRL
jgi:hypothetical protein